MEAIRNLTQQELTELKSKGCTKSFDPDYAVALDIELPEGAKFAFFDMEGNFLTYKIRVAERNYKGQDLIYFNPPTDQGKAFVYQF